MFSINIQFVAWISFLVSYIGSRNVHNFYFYENKIINKNLWNANFSWVKNVKCVHLLSDNHGKDLSKPGSVFVLIQKLVKCCTFEKFTQKIFKFYKLVHELLQLSHCTSDMTKTHAFPLFSVSICGSCSEVLQPGAGFRQLWVQAGKVRQLYKVVTTIAITFMAMNLRLYLPR